MKIGKHEIKLSDRTWANIADAKAITREWWSDMFAHPVRRVLCLVLAIVTAFLMMLPFLTEGY